MDNCQLPKGYKNTVVGVIPEDWEVKPLVEISHIATGTTPPTNNKNNYGEDYFFVSPADLGKGKYIVDTEKKLSKLGFSIARKYPANSILFTCIGSTIGKAGIAKIELTSNQQINAVFPNESYSSDFLFYYLNFISPKIKLGASEQAVPMINKTEFGKTFITLPTKSEQTAIATALSDADALINSLSTLIAKKRNIKQGAMQKLLKPKEGWEVKKLGEIAAFYKGKGLPKSHLKENGKYKCIHYGELFTKYKESISSILSYTDENENCFFSISNDVLMPTSDVTPNGLATASCIKQEGIILGGDVLVIRILPSILDGLFLSFYVSQNREKVMKLVSGSTVYHLYGSDMKDFEISYPKIDEQTRIATILSDMDAEIQAMESKLEKYRKIKLGMMQNLLTGKIRLIDN